MGVELCLVSIDFYELLVNGVRSAYHCGVAGVLWGMGVGVAVVAGARATSRWARRRCDEALADARLTPASSERSFALIAGLEGRSPGRAQVRQQRAFQPALDTERRGWARRGRGGAPTAPAPPPPARRPRPPERGRRASPRRPAAASARGA